MENGGVDLLGQGTSVFKVNESPSPAPPREKWSRRRKITVLVDGAVAVLFVVVIALVSHGSSTPGPGASAQNVAYCTGVTKLADGLGDTGPVHGQYSYLLLHRHLVSTLVGLAPKSVRAPTKDLVRIMTLTLEHQKNPGITSKAAERDANEIKNYCGIGG